MALAQTYVLWAILGTTFALLIILMGLIIKSRYKVFDTSNFVLHFRAGKLKNKSYGGSFFLIPVFDRYVVLSTAIQQVEIHAQDKVITRENQPVIVKGLLVWRITDPEAAYRAIGSQYGVDAMKRLNQTLEQIVESIIRTTVAKLSMDEVLRERQLIVEAIMKELISVVNDWGISIETVEVVQVELTNPELFQNLQAKFEQEAKKKAQEIQILTEMEVEQKRIELMYEVEKKKADKEQELRIYKAELDEKAKAKELERDRKVVEMQKAVALAQKKKELEVEKLEQEKQKQVGEIEKQKEIEFARLEKEREVTQAKYEKQRTEIQVQTDLLRRTKAAEAKKIEIIKTQVEVEAAKKKLQAAAIAEAKKLEAEAEAERIRKIAEAEAQSKLKLAEAEALKELKLAEATKKRLLAEAEGRKALLLAEAEGLREKVKAQQQINEAMLLHELIKQLPEIAKSIKVGEISWFNLANGNGNASPLGIIPKNMLEILGIAKHFGLDVNDMINKMKLNKNKATVPVLQETQNKEETKKETTKKEEPKQEPVTPKIAIPSKEKKKDAKPKTKK